MPRGDRTDPRGQGAGTGRGKGNSQGQESGSRVGKSGFCVCPKCGISMTIE
jgi:hypothetical protein